MVATRGLGERVLEAAPVVILLLDTEGRIQHVNPFFERLTGYELGDVRGKDWFETFLPLRDRERIRAVFRSSCDGRTVSGNVNPIVTRSGDERHIEWTDELVKDEDGRVRSLLAIGRDVTERVLAERTKRAMELKLRSIVDAMPVAVAAVDLEGTVLDVNRSALALAGLAREHVVGRPFVEASLHWLDPPHQVDAIVSAFERARRGERVSLELSLRVAGAGAADFDTVVGPLFDEEGRVEAVIASGYDVTDRKAAQDALSKSEKRLAEAHRLANIGAWELDLVTGSAWWSDEQRRMLGVPLDAPVSRELFMSLVHPDDRRQLESLLASALRTGGCEEVFRIVRADGQVRSFHGVVRTTYDPAGNPTALSGTNEDATERVETEAALRESEELLRIFVEYAPAQVAMLDRELRYIACSRRWISDYGLEGKEVIGRTHYEIFPDIPPRWREIHARCLSGVAEKCEDDRFERADGSVEYLRWEIQPWRDARGDVGGLVFFTEIVTEQKRAEVALRRSEKGLKEAQRLAQIGSWELELPDNRLRWSDGLYRLFELDPRREPPSYARFLEVVHPDDRELVDEGYRRSIAEKRPHRLIHRLLMPDGRVKYVDDQWETEFEPDGTPVFSRGTLQDMTSRRLAEMQIADALREKETLLREIHHRVKNNLQMVSSLLHFQSSKATSEPVLTAFKDLRARLLAMSLVHERLYQSRDLAEVDLGDYVRSIVAALGALLDSRVAMTVHVPERRVVLPIDRALPVGMILCELVTNVHKYAWPGGAPGTARVSLAYEDGHVVIGVEDDGVGLPPAFDPESAGSFGWQLVRTLVRQLEGRIEVRSERGAHVRALVPSQALRELAPRTEAIA